MPKIEPLNHDTPDNIPAEFRPLKAKPRHRLRQAAQFFRNPILVPMATFVGLVAITAVGYGFYTRSHAPLTAPNTKVVVVSHDKVEQTVPSKERTVGELLKKLDISVGPSDVVEPKVETAIDQDDFRVNVYRAVPVEIVDNGHASFSFSAATTPRSIARQAGLSVYAEDRLETIPTTNFLADSAIGERVVVNRATPINLNLYGNQLAVRTHAATVGAVLAEKNIKLGPSDQVVPAAATAVAAGQQIFLLRQGSQVQTETVTLPMPVQTINDPNLAYGTSAVRQQGSPGQQVNTYQVTTQNGKPVGRQLIQSVTTRQAVQQIVVQGSNLGGIKGDMALAGISPSDYNAVDYIVGHESGWCPTKWQGDIGSCPAFHGTPPSYLGYGLCQATPGGKMSSAGGDWATNPITQLKWCSGYAQSRYGGWQGAYSHWLSNHSW